MCLALFLAVLLQAFKSESDIMKGDFSFLSGNHFTINTLSISQRAAVSGAISKILLIVMDVSINRVYTRGI